MFLGGFWIFVSACNAILTEMRNEVPSRRVVNNTTLKVLLHPAMYFAIRAFYSEAKNETKPASWKEKAWKIEFSSR